MAKRKTLVRQQIVIVGSSSGRRISVSGDDPRSRTLNPAPSNEMLEKIERRKASQARAEQRLGLLKLA